MGARYFTVQVLEEDKQQVQKDFHTRATDNTKNEICCTLAPIQLSSQTIRFHDRTRKV